VPPLPCHILFPFCVGLQEGLLSRVFPIPLIPLNLLTVIIFPEDCFISDKVAYVWKAEDKSCTAIFVCIECDYKDRKD
jgi:hypothetical protein